MGVTLSGIRAGSLLSKLGLRNGDTLRTLNGFDLSSPDAALSAYTKLRSAHLLSLSLLRQGNALTQEYGSDE